MRFTSSLLITALVGFGCRTPKASPLESQESAPSESASRIEKATGAVDSEGRFRSTVDFLLARHDANGDGRITPQEYGRSGENFSRLDKNEDGVLSAEDWVRPSSDGRMHIGKGTERARAERAGLVLAEYFQEADAAHFETTELAASFKVYDTSGDGKLTADEFQCACEARKVDLPGMQRRLRQSPWETLIAGADEDGDEALAPEELSKLFAMGDAGADGVWTFQAPKRRGGAPRARPVAPREGEVAPDFTLSPPGGGEAVTLSSFAGDKPVALIFGSYT